MKTLFAIICLLFTLNNTFAWEYKTSKDNTVRWLRTVISLYFEKWKVSADEFGISKITQKYNKQWLVVEKIYSWLDNNLIWDQFWVAKSTYKYDKNKELIEYITYGEDGNLIEEEWFAKIIYKRNINGKLTLRETYGENGLLKWDDMWISKYLWEYDKYGNTLKQIQYGIDWKLKEDSTGFAKYGYIYDYLYTKWRQIRVWITTYWADWKPKNNEEWIASKLVFLDKNPNYTWFQFKDEYGNISSSWFLGDNCLQLKNWQNCWISKEVKSALILVIFKDVIWIDDETFFKTIKL